MQPIIAMCMMLPLTLVHSLLGRLLIAGEGSAGRTLGGCRGVRQPLRADGGVPLQGARRGDGGRGAGQHGRGPGPLGRGGRHARQDLVRLAVLVCPPGDDHRRQLVDQVHYVVLRQHSRRCQRFPGSSLRTCIGLERACPACSAYMRNDTWLCPCKTCCLQQTSTCSAIASAESMKMFIPVSEGPGLEAWSRRNRP